MPDQNNAQNNAQNQQRSQGQNPQNPQNPKEQQPTVARDDKQRSQPNMADKHNPARKDDAA